MSVRGWNDPPQFPHSSLDAQGIKKSKLTQRPTHPHPTPPPSHTSTTSPHNPPPLSRLHSEAVVVDDREQFPGVTDSGHECGGVKDYSRVIDGLQSQLDRYKTSMLRREVEEVRKRLETMRRQWQEGALSTPVMTQMTTLLQALEAGEVSVAQSIQVALMVDHTSEVSLWMMGVKRLINRAEKQLNLEPKNNL